MQPVEGMELDNPTWSGPCVGGPVGNHEMVSRYPRGFLLVDRPSQTVWIYDWVAGPEWQPERGQFIVREAGGRPLIEDEAAEKNRYRAADEAEFDVLAHPGIGADEW